MAAAISTPTESLADLSLTHPHSDSPGAIGQSDREVWESVKPLCTKLNFPPMKLTDQNQSNTQFRNRPLLDPSMVFDQNAWDNVEWDDEMKQEAMTKVQKNSRVVVEPEVKELYEAQAANYWDQFYGVHKNKFFKQRNWLLNEFPDLQSPQSQSESQNSQVKNVGSEAESYPGENSSFRVLEVGCGNGSTVFPLLAANKDPNLFVYCCDFSPAAVQVVQTSPDLEPTRCLPFVWDVTSSVPSLPFPPSSLRVITLIFVLSAISPDKYDQVMVNLNRILEPGGCILFRDYGLHDMVQLRIPEGRCISHNFYARGDGTRVFFFQEDEVSELFRRHGFEQEKLFIDRRLQVNRSKGIKMYRIWIQGKFIKK